MRRIRTTFLQKERRKKHLNCNPPIPYYLNSPRPTVNSSHEGKAIESVPEADVAVQHDVWLPRAVPSPGFVPIRRYELRRRRRRRRRRADGDTVDAEIVKDATRCKMDLAGGLQRTLHGAVKPSTYFTHPICFIHKSLLLLHPQILGTQLTATRTK